MFTTIFFHESNILISVSDGKLKINNDVFDIDNVFITRVNDDITIKPINYRKGEKLVGILVDDTNLKVLDDFLKRH